MKELAEFFFSLSIICLIFQFKLSEGVSKGPLVQCKRSDPNLDQCLMEKLFTRNFFQGFKKDNKKYNIKKRDPQHIRTVESGVNNLGLKFKLTNGLVYGQSNAVITKFHIDLKKQELFMECKAPKLTILTDYVMSGRVMILPMDGKGKGNITALHTTLHCHSKWDLIKKNGVEYVKLTSQKYSLKPKKLIFQFDNLFNGDKFLGKQMNIFINENSKELEETFLPLFENALAEEDVSEFSKLFDVVPYDSLYII